MADTRKTSNNPPSGGGTSPRKTPIGTCDGVRELIAAYAFGATDRDETEHIERELRDCPELGPEIATYRALTGDLEMMLPAEVPQMEPPARLLGSILKAARASRPDADVRSPGRAESADYGVPPRVFKKRVRSGPDVNQNQTIRLLRLLAAILIVVLSAGFLISMLSASLNTRDRLAMQVAEQETVLEALRAARVTWIRLDTAPAGENTDAFAYMVWQRDTGLCVLVARQMPALQQDTTFQIWVHREGQIISMGTFVLDETGNATVALDFELVRPGYDRFGVTIEPEGGSAQPTTESVVRFVRSNS